MNFILWAGGSIVGAAVMLLPAAQADDRGADTQRWAAFSEVLDQANQTDTERRWEQLSVALETRASEHDAQERDRAHHANGLTQAQLGRALRNAARYGHRDVTKALLAAGADPDARDPHGNTPLMIAARYGDSGVAEELIHAGADVTLVAKDGDTALLNASIHGYSAIVRLITGVDDRQHARSGH